MLGISEIQPVSAVITAMAQPKPDRIRQARQEAGLSQDELAKLVGIRSREAVSQWEKGTTSPIPKRWDALARALNVTVSWLQGGNDLAEKSDSPRLGNASRPQTLNIGGDLLPVYGQAASSSDGRLLLNGEVVDYVPAPKHLATVPGAYAVYVFGDSMEPRYFAGEAVYVNPALPVKPLDWVVVQLADAEGSFDSGYIKRFARWTETHLVLSQLNPHKDIRIERSRVKSVHRIVGGHYP